MKRKQEDETSWWFYFDLVHNKAKAKCKNCGKVLDRDERFSTSGMKYHLKQYHPALYSKKLEAVNCKRQKEEQQKKSVVDPKEFFKPRISDAPKSANQPDIQKALGFPFAVTGGACTHPIQCLSGSFVFMGNVEPCDDDNWWVTNALTSYFISYY
uniref:BED-type domain-containing protein n=1 Tax=Ditylenchus dipsaci TaxID=166011 RepID=A0A915DG72_9BILA